MLIFSDYHAVDHWISKLELQEPYEICNDLEEFIAKDSNNKIAFTKGRAFDYDNPMIHDNDLFADYINKLSSISRLVFSFDTEMHDFHFDIYEKCHKDNVYWVTSGFINDIKYSNNIILWMYFLETTINSYKHNLNYKLQELNTDYNKPLFFDALLGRPRTHRDFIYNQINKHELNNNCILTYQHSDNGEDYKNFWDSFLWEPNIITPLKGKAGTEQFCQYEGVDIALSRIIPIKIYNDTAYSIIAETNCNNDYSFYTEKTSKPFIAKRIFVMFSGWKMLENLRKLGFKTFGNLIDESYDSIQNNEERWTAAFEQVLKLSNMDQHTAYSSVNDVIEYNHNHIMNTNWTQLALDKIKQVIYSTNK